ncbi:MAG: ATP-binding protein [Halobacteriota archaeon]
MQPPGDKDTSAIDQLRGGLERSRLFEMAINHIDHPIVITDRQGRIVEVNLAAERAAGRPRDAMVGRPLAESGVAGASTDALASVVSGAEGEHEQAAVSLHLDAGGHSLDEPDTTLTVTPVTDITGRIAYRLVELGGATPDAPSSAGTSPERRDLEEFVRTLAHELRSPLSLATGYAELLSDDVEADELDRLQAALERIDQLLDDMVLLVKDGSYVDELVEVDIGDLAEEAWSTIDTRDATLIVESTTMVMADRTRLLQVFENLFRNAVEHAGPGVTLRVGTQSGGIYVEDDGEGIPAEYRDEIFDPGVSIASEGSGLGLSIVRNIVEAHDWSITIGEAESGGARFEIGVE